MKIPITKFVSATVLLAIFVVNMIWWFRVTDRYSSFEDSRTAYLSAFPTFLQHPLLLTIIAFIVLMISGTLFLQTRKVKQLKILSIVGYCISFSFAFWQLFSLM
ncbi:hypothetical protein [Pedobacter rhizosphaerae]|uniref:Uncharacterized protein n=1 Tax=Pedobacter rhizosphaerae TaxID=390241 RepID=A0A1H9TWR6_9SPHI|nr:hypothetical protein [Pedobacter rhizosphaerae]SES01559.1 hypothetical protein SAMN04488023_12524 [Pedobacter rhizosphaerae]